MKIFEDIKNRKLKFVVLATFSAVLCLTVSCEIWYSSYANQELILRFEKDHYLKKASEIATDWLNSYFKQVELIISVLSQNNLISEGKKSEGKKNLEETENEQSDAEKSDFSDFEDLFKEGIKKTPFTLAFYIGLADGRYLNITHLQDLHQIQDNLKNKLPSYVTYMIKKIDNNTDGKMIERRQYFNDDLTFISEETLATLSIDPRKRPWYMQTEINKCVSWTDVYMFKSTKVPGITVTSPVIRDGNFVGAVAVDFAINEFKNLLTKNIKPTEHSEVRLINDKNEIIASTSENDEVNVESDNDIILPKISETTDEALSKAVKELLGRNKICTSYKLKNGSEYIATIQKLDKTPFSLVMTAPQSDFIEDLITIQQRMFFISALTFLCAFHIIILLSRRISDPIAQLCKTAHAIKDMNLENFLATPKSNIAEIQALSDAMNSIRTNISTFSKYTPKDLVRKLLKEGSNPELGGKTEEITLFFSHIENFTTISEKLPAEYLIFHLSEYFAELTKSISQYNGTIDKYIGDAIMAIWGAPSADEEQSIHACEAALSCQEILMQLSKKWLPLGKPALPTQIGIHTGSAVVGNIGSRDRMNFTAIGDAVNIASRLGGANKFYGTKVLVSETVEIKARKKILFRVIDKIAVKGRSSGITVFEPLCSIKDADENYYKLIDLCAKSKEAFELFQAQKFKDAMKIYNEIKSAFPGKSSSIEPLIERCKELIAHMPPNWDGTNHLNRK